MTFPEDNATDALCALSNSVPDGDDGALWRVWMRNKRDLYKQYGQDSVDLFFAESYPFYEDSECKMFSIWLMNASERVSGGGFVKKLVDEYEGNGILLRREGEQVTVVHPCAKNLSNDMPIQVSKWLIDRGVIGDSLYKTIEEAIKDNGLLTMDKICDSEIDSVEGNLVDNEALYQVARNEFQKNTESAATSKFRVKM